MKNKDFIVHEVRNTVLTQYGGAGGLCLHFSVAMVRTLNHYGYRAVLQAGSAQWRCMKEDDGFSPTHFAYMWETSEQTKFRIMNGLLPEIHCWVGLPETQEIVDISTHNLVQQAKDRAGIIWTADPPPDYIWGGVNDLPNGCRYIVSPTATMVALSFAKKICM